MALALPVAAGAQDTAVEQFDFGGFRMVMPGGQGETVNAAEFAAFQASGERPRSFVDQIPLYSDLIQVAPTLRASDLDSYFRPATFGTAGTTLDATPRPGVEIYRDEWNVPKVFGQTRADTMFGAGYASAQDRLFLMDVLRHTGRGRLTELIGAGEDDSTVRMDAEQLKIADYTEEELQGMIDSGTAKLGAEGQEIRQDLDAYVAGINAYIAEARLDPDKMPVEYAALGKEVADWKPTDTVAIASLIGGIFGRGGGDEARVSLALAELRKRFGRRAGRRAFEDFRDRDDPEAPVTIRKRFKFFDPGRADRRAVARLDPGSFREADLVTSGGEGQSSAAQLPWLRRMQEDGLVFPTSQSNVLLVDRRKSRSGRPLAVMGPQVGYYSPQILMEMELHGPDGLHVRGATFPGISLYILLGRGQDFAWSATTATTDVVDEFAEKLCEPDGSEPSLESTHYVRNGRCIPFETREHVLRTTKAPTDLLPPPDLSPPRTITLKLERSVHGPIQGRATVRGEPVAIAEARSTYFHELDSALAFKRLNMGEVASAKDFQRAMHRVNFAFNWFYADDRDIAYLNSGWYPRRARGTHPDLPAWGTGAWDWQGFDPDRFTSRRLPFRRLPKAINPRQRYIVNWNNKQAPGWRAADDQWGFGAIHRSTRLERRLRRAIRGKRRVGLAGVTRVMALGGTTDLRGYESYRRLRRMTGRGPAGEVREAIGLMDAWTRAGSHRRDLDGDGVVEHSAAAAVMDEWWPRLVRRAFEPALGVDALERIRDVHSVGSGPSQGGSSFGSGWWGHLDKDLRALLGMRVRNPLSRPYCGAAKRSHGRGRRARCRTVLVGALRDAVAAAKEKYGVERLADIRMEPACDDRDLCDQIAFTTGGAVGTPDIPWQDRPTFQQVVEVQGHRER